MYRWWNLERFCLVRVSRFLCLMAFWKESSREGREESVTKLGHLSWGRTIIHPIRLRLTEWYYLRNGRISKTENSIRISVYSIAVKENCSTYSPIHLSGHYLIALSLLIWIALPACSDILLGHRNVILVKFRVTSC